MSPFRLSNGRIAFARDVFGLGRVLRDDRHGTLWTLLELMDGTMDVPALTTAMRRARPELHAGATRRAVARLHQIGVVEDAANDVSHDRPGAPDERYSRNIDFFSLVTVGSPRTPESLQRQLKGARVTILGIGAIGSTIAASLAAAGVGHLKIVDPDRVELSNLNRQLLYASRDVGRWKVDAAADYLRAINPRARVTTGRRRVRSRRDLPPLLRGCDLFILGADQPHEILLWTNDAAAKSRTAWLENSYSGPRCAIAIFVPGRTPCLRCLQHQLEVRQRRQGMFAGSNLFADASANPVIAPTAGIAGQYGALRALYYLTGLRSADDGGLIQLNLWTADDVQFIRPRFWRDCPIRCRTLAGRS